MPFEGIFELSSAYIPQPNRPVPTDTTGTGEGFSIR